MSTQEPSLDEAAPFRRGLDGVVVAQTELSYPDTCNGRLVVRGVDIVSLVHEPDFIDACHFLWGDLVLEKSDEREFGKLRMQAYERFLVLAGALQNLVPADGMRMLISSLPDDPSRPTSPAAILASSGMAAAMAIRVAAGGKLAPPDPMASHAADLLRLIRGTASPASHVRAFEIYLVAMMEHSLNASTFAARVVASTGAGMVAAVTASLAALRGPLHGGALALVLDMLDEARSSPDAGAYVSRRLAIGPRLFGFGSRGYTGRDPRADIFKRALLEFEGDRSRVAYAEEFESAALECLRQKKSGRRIETNVEFYAALLLEAIGIPRSGFTAVFAASRCAGWIGHIREEERDGRLMRPAARYVGTMPA